jgi:serine protease AprX
MVALAAVPVSSFVRTIVGPMVSVIVRELPGSGAEPEHAVGELGGRVTSHIGIIDAFVAEVPHDSLARLKALSGVHSVTINRRVQLLGYLDGWDHEHDLGSMYSIAQEVTGAGEMWNDRWTGKGVDIALIDSGVVPVEGLTEHGKVITGPDLSFESQAENLRYLDTFGHGTHMAGIMAGKDDRAPQVIQKGVSKHFVGMAPDARIVSIKVADATGAADVSQVIAAIDWVVSHRRDRGMNIRVLNLSFGTDGTQDYRIDPLAYAAEVAWRHGIVVVVAAGNAGYGSAKLNNPAYDPYVIAVGAADGRGTYDVKDDVIADFSSTGDGTRNPDLVAPGKSVVSLRAPGAYIDQTSPMGRVGNSRFFKGSGTSQAAAVVSGAAALIIEQRPKSTPDQVKAILKASASRLPMGDPVAQGAGMLNLKLARDLPTPPSSQAWPASTGVGSLELSRGSAHVVHEGAELRGEQDVLGGAWDGNSWSGNSWTGNSWSGGAWNGNSWTGDCWCTRTWTGNSWTGNSWTGNSWSGNSWTGNSWSGNSWTGNSWSSQGWPDIFHGTASSGNAWSGIWGE